jgi:hypothetical protein
LRNGGTLFAALELVTNRHLVTCLACGRLADRQRSGHTAPLYNITDTANFRDEINNEASYSLRELAYAFTNELKARKHRPCEGRRRNKEIRTQGSLTRDGPSAGALMAATHFTDEASCHFGIPQLIGKCPPEAKHDPRRFSCVKAINNK